MQKFKSLEDRTKTLRFNQQRDDRKSWRNRRIWYRRVTVEREIVKVARQQLGNAVYDEVILPKSQLEHFLKKQLSIPAITAIIRQGISTSWTVYDTWSDQVFVGWVLVRTP